MRRFVTLALIIISTFPCLAEIPRPEHPKPQFQREQWINLNGEWDFAIDYGQSGVERSWYKDTSFLTEKITVPFCPESKLSGIHNRDFMPAVWYHRSFEVPAEWNGQRIFLHFGGVDYLCRAWVNGEEVGRHYGGSVSFAFEITKMVKPGENELVVLAEDDIRNNHIQPAGKQSTTYFNQGCCRYTRVTGIWQTVWLEARPQSYLESVRITPDLDNSRFVLTPVIKNERRGQQFRVTLFSADGEKLQAVTAKAGSGKAVLVDVKNPQIWSPQNPYLYDMIFELVEKGKTIDRVKSYAGLRKIHIEGDRIFLNNKPIFLRFVLDQGFYPDGVWTAPTDHDLKRDIELAMAVGFNGARLHQKVFEERFHYWADRLGYLTWGEFADWGGSHSYLQPEGFHNLYREWSEAIRRDLNHPSILAWTPYNEAGWDAKTNLEAYRRAVLEIYDLTRALDPSRPINDASGWIHIKTDIYTVHDYTQNPELFMKRYALVSPENRDSVYVHNWKWFGGKPKGYNVKWEGEPYVVDEYGGTFWLPTYADEELKGNGRRNWGYGRTGDQVVELIHKLTQALTSNPHISGFTYTQLTDVEQEVNGIYTFDRKLKFDAARLRRAFGQPAAVERTK